MTSWAFLRSPVGRLLSLYMEMYTKVMVLAKEHAALGPTGCKTGTLDCNPGIRDPRILAWFLIPKSRDCRGPNLGISGLQILLKKT